MICASSNFDEFSGITNKQAYELAFKKRMMLPHPTETGRFLGNTQRDDFLPYLKPELSRLPEEVEIFDFGAGSGEIVDLALQDLKKATVNIEDPNVILLLSYVRKLSAFPHLKLGVCYSGPIQDFYSPTETRAREPLPKRPQNLILGLHMIYFLSDFRRSVFDPDKDLQDAMEFMYGLLEVGGTVFLAYAHQVESTGGHAARYYYRKQPGGERLLTNLEKLWQSRERLLRQKEIGRFLATRFADSRPVVESFVTPSYIYGRTPEDITAMCLAGELLEANDEPFDIDKLRSCADFVRLHGPAIGLTIEVNNVIQRNMYRNNQPQVITIIRRTGPR